LTEDTFIPEICSQPLDRSPHPFYHSYIHWAFFKASTRQFYPCPLSGQTTKGCSILSIFYFFARVNQEYFTEDVRLWLNMCVACAVTCMILQWVILTMA
jgi:hypothetical protein